MAVFTVAQTYPVFQVISYGRELKIHFFSVPLLANGINRLYLRLYLLSISAALFFISH